MDGPDPLVFWVSGGPLTDVEFAATGLREIVQCVRTILATARGSLFLDRNFGIRQNMVDDPFPVAMQKFIGEVVAEVERQEPRVKVLKAEFTNPGAVDASDGSLYPRVLLRIREGVLL